MAGRTEITRTYRFESAHRLPNVPEGHKCARLHGHSFRVTLAVGREVDPTLGWILDFAEIDEAWKPLRAILDHRYLNEIEGLENPTSELLSKWIFERVKLAKGYLVSVTVHETCTSSTTYFGDREG